MHQPGMDLNWDPYGLKLQTDRKKLKRELSRMQSLASKHHVRCPDCELRRCPNPYEPILFALEDRLTELGDKPIKFRAYLVKVVGKLRALWGYPR